MKQIKQVIDMGFSLKEDYKYPLFLCAILSFFFLPSFFPDRIESFLDTIFFVLLIITSFILLESKSFLKRGVVMFAGLTGTIIQISGIFMVVPLNIKLTGFIALFIMFIILFHDLINQIFRSKKITLNVVLGAFTGYILIGIIGFCVILTIYLLNPESFSITEDPIHDLLYYSFITLSTIGYGDISPLSLQAKNFAVILGIVGQFYNVIIMAAIIGKFLQSEDE